ncbi:hypothetical protein Vretifemale_5853 [Volvox reticuliferus]|uniref:Uncharacterized protein n=1 Tax=Volvox reticuliferus TaxID=1737510 RepID=A0A8J4FIV8_9CHLO|nr:hypothetical protein Vretifemale_5853 [Volvox reticuliferus]
MARSAEGTSRHARKLTRYFCSLTLFLTKLLDPIVLVRARLASRTQHQPPSPSLGVQAHVGFLPTGSSAVPLRLRCLPFLLPRRSRLAAADTVALDKKHPQVHLSGQVAVVQVALSRAVGV